LPFYQDRVGNVQPDENCGTGILVLEFAFVRFMFKMDTSGSWGLLTIAGFFIACGFVVYGEYWLLGV